MKFEYLPVFEEMFQIHYPHLINFACKYVLDKSIAEDILQDVFMSMWIRKDSIDFESQEIKPYLYKSVHNRCINYIKSIKESLPLNHCDIDFLIQQEIFEERTFDFLLLKELEKELEYSIKLLPPQCKKVFTYSRKHGLKNKEIAELLNISEKTVEKHITKALHEIRQHLKKMNLISVLFFLFKIL